jgi:uncharacterized protein YggE
MTCHNAIAAALVALLLPVVSPAATLAQPASPLPTPAGAPARVIAVTGQGSVDATPDEATVTLGVEITRPTAQDAQIQGAAVMDRIVRQVSALGIPAEQIHTAAVNLLPIRKPGTESEEVSGYQATDRVVVTIDDLRLTGQVIDAAVKAGANAVDGLVFGLRDPSPYRARALGIAVQNARATATAIASAAGVSNLRLVRIDEIGPVVFPRAVAMQAAPMAGASTPVLPGTVQVTAQVRVLYAF